MGTILHIQEESCVVCVIPYNTRVIRSSWSFDLIPFFLIVKKASSCYFAKPFSSLFLIRVDIWFFFFQDLVAYQENCKKDVSLIERNSQSILQCVTSTEVLQHFHQSIFQKKVTQVQITFQVKKCMFLKICSYAPDPSDYISSLCSYSVAL